MLMNNCPAYAIVLLAVVLTVQSSFAGVFVFSIAQHAGQGALTGTSDSNGELVGTILISTSAGIVPLSGGLVEARNQSTHEVVASTLTQPNGSYHLWLPPGDYELTFSVSRNVDLATITGRATITNTPLKDVNVTAVPRRTVDLGGSALTNSSGYYNLTVGLYAPVPPLSVPVSVPVGEIANTGDILLQLAGSVGPGAFDVTFAHPTYPNVVFRGVTIKPGSLILNAEMNSGLISVTTLVTFQGSQYSTVVNGNASASNIQFDVNRRLLNFSISGSGIGEFVVLIPKSLLDGTPVVFVDNREVASSYAQNLTHYFVRFRSSLSQHLATIGGSQTIPEFSGPWALAFGALLAVVVLTQKARLSRDLVGPNP
jgi:hypothetical protein